MDKRSIYTTIAFTLILLGLVALQRYAQTKYPVPETPVTPTPAGTAGAPAQTGTPGGIASATNPVAGQPLSTNWHVMANPASNPAALPVALGSAVPDDKTYALQLNVNPQGAGLNDVVLNQFKSSEDFMLPVKDRRLYVYQTPAPGIPTSDAAALATQAVEINGNRVDLWSADWTLETAGPSGPPGGSLSVTYSITVATDAPGLKILKTFTVNPISSAGKGFEVGVDYKLQNLSALPLNVKLIYNGPTLPPKEGGRGADRQVMAAYREGADDVVLLHPIEEFKKDKQETLDVGKNDKGPLAWAGTCSVYFDALVLPLKDDSSATGNSAVGDYVENVTARGWLYDNSELTADERPVTLTFTTTGQALGPGQSVSLPSDVYFGPKSRDVLSTAYYSAVPRHYDASLVAKSGWWICGVFQSESLIKLMVLLLTGFHWIAGGFAGHGDWGIAIILLVGVVRLCLHPITKRSQVQMMKMGKMGPEMERLKKKYADDKDELNRQMMQFYKAQGAAPILGCLPMFLQMPIWIALYSSLQSTFALRQAPFLWNLTWIHDLSKPDFLLHFSHSVALPFGAHMEGVNLLPLLLGAVFFVQQKYMTPPNPAMTEDQLKQQKMMQYMTPFIFPVMLYNGPSGLNLYIFASTLFGVIESKIIRKHIKEREAAEKAERVIVDAKPTRQGKKLARSETPEVPPTGGLRGFWANLQERVEEARRRTDGRK
jgi:YidC/Oxa1 family membrane protein insertase